MDYKKLSQITDSANFTPAQGYMAAPEKLFALIGNKEGVEVIKAQGDTKPGRPYEAQDGRVWALSDLYIVKFNGNKLKFNVVCLSNEGWDPSSKTEFVEGRNGGKIYVGKSFGWILNDGPKQTWREVAASIKNQLHTIGL